MSEVRQVAIEKGLKNLADLPRDVYVSLQVAAAAYQHDLWQEDGAIGLDFTLYNTGAAAVLVTIDNDKIINIPAGGERGFNNILYSLIQVAVGTFNISFAGIRIRDV